MSAISLKSITGITSITTPAGVDNVFTVHTNDTTERFRVDQSGNLNIAGIITATSLTVNGDVTLGNTLASDEVTFNSKVNTNLLPSTNGNKDLGSSGNRWGEVHAVTFHGSGANLTSLPAQATIANNADNRVITGGSGVNLNGEANLTFNGTTLSLGASATSILKISNVPSGYTSGALKINTDFANYGHIQVRDKNQYQTAALNVENENDGADETCYIYRAVDLASSDWANARMGAKSHSFQTSADALGTNRRLLVDTDGIRVDGRVSGSHQVSGIRVNTDILNYGVVSVRDGSNSDQSNQIACFQAENGGNGGDETNIVTRSVNRNSTQWANAKYAAKSHIWVTNGSVDANIKLRITSDGDLGVGVATPTFAAINSISANAAKGIEIFKDGTDTGSAIKLAGDNGSGNKAYSQLGYSGANATAHWANYNTSGTLQGQIVIGSTGKIGINNASPDGTLHVYSSSAGTVTADAGGDELVLESSGNTGLSILSPGSGESTIFFGNPGTNGQKDGYIRYYHETHSTTANRRSLIFVTGGGDNERLRITSDGKVGINETSPAGLLDVRSEIGSHTLGAIFRKDYNGDTTDTSHKVALTIWGQDHNDLDHTGQDAYGPMIGFGARNDDTAPNTGDIRAAISYRYNGNLTFHTEAGGSVTDGSNERLRITGDGAISFDQGTTAAITPSQTTATSVGHQTMSGGSSWFNHGTGTDYFGVDGDFKLTNGATYGKIVARNSSGAISNATEAGHTWFMVCKTVAGTLGNSNWVVEPVAGWKMAWPTSLAAGATTTFYMRDAVESYGSPTIPASGDYYIGWFYSVSQQMGTNGGSYYVDATTGGKIYYYSSEGDLSNPHQRIPRQGDSWDAINTGEKIHFRFETLPKADLTGTVFASPLLVDPVMEGTPLIDGLPMAGGQLVKDVQWSTNVSSVEFTNADFVNCNYLVTYAINGSNGNNSSTGWYQTRLQFCDHDGVYKTGTNDYISHCEWVHSTSTSPSINSSFAGYARSIWLTGNGSNYDHEGYVWIIPSNFRHNRDATISQRWANGTEEIASTHPRILVRGHSFLSAGNEGNHYREEGGGTYRGSNDYWALSGFRLYGSNSSDYHTPAPNGSSNGYVRIWRFKSGFEAREVS